MLSAGTSPSSGAKNAGSMKLVAIMHKFSSNGRINEVDSFVRIFFGESTSRHIMKYAGLSPVWSLFGLVELCRGAVELFRCFKMCFFVYTALLL